MRFPFCFVLSAPLLFGALGLSGCSDDPKPAARADTISSTDLVSGTDASADSDVAAADSAIVVDPCVADPLLGSPPIPPLRTPRWAFEPWISKDISTGPDSTAFVQGFLDRDIPVGVLVLDSPWETHYNTFIPSPTRYPDFANFTKSLRQNGVRTVVWTTQMVNATGFDFEVGGDVYDGPAPLFEQGKTCGHYINDGETYTWWKGDGAGIDFFSPAARTWWNRQQLDILQHVDGYKLDFGEMYITTVPMQTAKGQTSMDEYSSAYYKEMLAFGVSRNPEFLTMVRPYDKSYQFEGRFFAKPEHAPVAWVGDNRRDWVGLADALDHMFRSAAAGYTMVGSDLGGYLDRDDIQITEQVPFDPVNFARWTAIGALGPFMQLHGRGNFEPWSSPTLKDEVLAAYKYWAQWHHQFGPTLYSEVRRSQTSAGPLVLIPQGEQANWPGDYRYLLAGRWLVAPILDATGVRTVALPAGKQWLSWFALGAVPLSGGTTVKADVGQELGQVPLYLDACSLQAVVDPTALTGLAVNDQKGADGFLLAAATDTCTAASYVRLDEDGETTATWNRAGNSATLTVSRHAAKPLQLILRLPAEAKSVAVGGGSQPGMQWQPANKLLFVQIPAGAGEAKVTLGW
jgi:alpha-glucosidase (family GH31 glycosyl hydrolase)